MGRRSEVVLCDRLEKSLFSAVAGSNANERMRVQKYAPGCRRNQTRDRVHVLGHARTPISK